MTKVEEGAFYESPLAGESSHQFQAFCCYRDLGITRSLKRAAELFYMDGSPGYGYQGDTEGIPDSGGAAQLTRFKRWSRDNSWVARVEAFDAEEARKRSAQLQQHRIDAVEDNLHLVKLGANVLAKGLYDAARGETFFPPGGLPALMREVTTLQRLTLGEATAHLATTELDPDQHKPDYSILSDEEITAIDNALAKLYGPLD